MYGRRIRGTCIYLRIANGRQAQNGDRTVRFSVPEFPLLMSKDITMSSCMYILRVYSVHEERKFFFFENLIIALVTCVYGAVYNYSDWFELCMYSSCSLCCTFTVPEVQ